MIITTPILKAINDGYDAAADPFNHDIPHVCKQLDEAVQQLLRELDNLFDVAAVANVEYNLMNLRDNYNDLVEETIAYQLLMALRVIEQYC